MTDLFKLVGRVVIENQDANNEIDETTDKAEKGSNRMGSAFKKLGGLIATYLAVDKIIDFGKSIVNASAEVSAEVSAFEQIMGDYSDKAQTKLNEIADATGVVSSRLTPYMTSLTAKFKGLGFDVDEATTLAKDGLMLASDASAFWDKSLDDAMGSLNSFINGSYEGGEAIGLFANDTQLAAYAVKNGVVDTTKAWSSLDEATKQATRLQYAQDMYKLSGATGQAAKEADQYANVQANLTEKWRQFKAEIGEPLLENVVLPTMKKLSDLVDGLSETYKNFTTWLKNHKEEMKIVKGVVIGLTSAIGSFLLILNWGSIMSIATSGLLAVKKAMVAVNLAMASNPIGLVVSLIVGLVASFLYFWNTSEGFRQFFYTLWDSIKEVFNGIVEAISNAWNGVKEWTVNTWNGIIEWLKPFIDGIANFFKVAWSGISNTFKTVWNSIKNTVTTVWNAIKTIISIGMQIITNLITLAIDLWLIPWNFIWQNFGDYIKKAWDFIKNIISKGINFVLNIIKTVMNNVYIFITTVWNGIKTAISTVVNVIKTIITTVFNAVKNVIMNIFNGIKMVVSNVWNGIKSVITSVVNVIKSVVTTVFNAVKNVIMNVFNGIKNVSTNVWNGIKDGISNVVNGIKNVVSNVFNAVKNTISNVFGGIKNTATNVWNAIKNAITGPVEKAKEIVGGIIDKIKGFFNFKWSLPKLKLPHFSVQPSGWQFGDLLKGKIPKLGIEWYAKGGIMEQPTAFGINPLTGNTMVGGEAGPEAIAPISELMDYVRIAVAESNGGTAELLKNVIKIMLEFFPQFSNMHVVLEEGAIVGRLAPKLNEKLGQIRKRDER